MEEKITLTENDILEKEFKIDARGYRLQEVDKFLDIIIGDYTNFHKIIAKYDNELKSVMEENIRLKNEIRNLKSTLSVAENSRGVTNVDILTSVSFCITSIIMQGSMFNINASFNTSETENFSGLDNLTE